MAEEQATAPATDAAAGTPPEQPTPAAAPEAARNDPQLVSAYTQATQTNSAVRTALGLSREAGTAQILDAIAVLKQRQDEENVDPRAAKDLARANETMWRAQSSIYGADFVAGARALMDEAQTLRDPEEFTTRLAALVQGNKATQAAAAPPPVEQRAAPSPEANLTLGEPPLPRGTVEFTREEILEMRQGKDGPQRWYENLLARSRAPKGS